MSLGPVCVSCKREMYCAKNEVKVRDKVEKGAPSIVREGDLFECDLCHRQIIIGFGRGILFNSGGPSYDEARPYTRRGQ
jgi:hypothetical protein